jgi:hypothetical protein
VLASLHSVDAGVKGFGRLCDIDEYDHRQVSIVRLDGALDGLREFFREASDV